MGAFDRAMVAMIVFILAFTCIQKPCQVMGYTCPGVIHEATVVNQRTNHARVDRQSAKRSLQYPSLDIIIELVWPLI